MLSLTAEAYDQIYPLIICIPNQIATSTTGQEQSNNDQRHIQDGEEMRAVKSVETFDQKVDAAIAYRLKAKRSPTSEILSWLLTNGELVLSGLRSTEISTINE